MYRSVPLALSMNRDNAYGYVCTENIIDSAVTEFTGISGTVKEHIDNVNQGELIEISKEEFFKVWNEAE